jgi:sugar phosphate isomerase/epimerase
LNVHIEFSSFSSINSLTKARRFLARGRPGNASIAVDVLHLYRNDGGIEGLFAADPTPIGYAQICDGPLISLLKPGYEAVRERLMPGAGVFDLPGFLRGLPQDIVLDIETPSEALKARGLTPLERARVAVDATRALFDQTARRQHE